MATECNIPILELQLNSTFLTASECLVLAGNKQLSQLKHLDLSCNPITITGLLNLVHPRRSSFDKLISLTLYNCEVDYTQAYLVSNDNLTECRVNFCLRSLNLSHNSLSYLLNYVSELGLINPELEKLMLVNCALDDEQVLKLSDSKKITNLATLDLSENLLDGNFPVIIRALKDNCDFLANVFLGGNKGIKNSNNMQIAKGKKSSCLPLL